MGERYYREQMKPRKKVMPLPSQNFGAVGHTLQSSGFVPIPLDGKKPIPKNWSGFWLNPPSETTYASWIKRNASANVGICTGEVVAIDIDLEDQEEADTAEALAFSILGGTQFVRLGRAPRRQLFYRLSYVEARQTSSWQVGKVELLADGKQSVVFGVHPNTGKPFTWPIRSILGVSINELPTTTIDKLDHLRLSLLKPGTTEKDEPVKSQFSLDYSPQVGERDKYLFWCAKEQAATAEAFDVLLERVLKLNIGFEEPLPLKQAKAKAESAWKLKLKGKLILQGAAAPTMIRTPRTIMAKLIRKLDPQAAKLLLGLSVNRYSEATFTIPQQATADAFGMSKGSLVKALKQLISFGMIIDTGEIKRVSLQPRPAKLYRFGNTN